MTKGRGAPPAKRARALATCGQCGQSKKGHTCPVTSNLKQVLWANDVRLVGGTCSVMVTPFQTDGCSRMSGAPCGVVVTDGDSGRIAVMAKLLERVERRLSARGEAMQTLHSTSNPQQPTSSGAGAEASAGAGA